MNTRGVVRIRIRTYPREWGVEGPMKYCTHVWHAHVGIKPSIDSLFPKRAGKVAQLTHPLLKQTYICKAFSSHAPCVDLSLVRTWVLNQTSFLSSHGRSVLSLLVYTGGQIVHLTCRVAALSIECVLISDSWLAVNVTQSQRQRLTVVNIHWTVHLDQRTLSPPVSPCQSSNGEFSGRRESTHRHLSLISLSHAGTSSDLTSIECRDGVLKDCPRPRWRL